MQMGQQTPFTLSPTLAVGMAAMACSICYLLGVMQPVFGAFFVYAAPLPLFVITLLYGFRSLALASLMGLVGISMTGSLPLSAHFLINVIAGVMWYGYVKSHSGTKQRVLFGWMVMGLVTIAMNLADATLMKNLEMAAAEMTKIQLSRPELASLALSGEELTRAIKIVPAFLAGVWIGSLALSVRIAQTIIAKYKKTPAPVKTTKFFAAPLPEGCFYLLLISSVGCFLENPELKIFFLNAMLNFLNHAYILGNE